MAKDNPFARRLTQVSDAKQKAVEEAADQVRARRTNEELKQAGNEGGGGEREQERIVAEAEKADEQAGSEFGLGIIGFTSARDRVEAEVDDSSGDPAPEVADAPANRIAAGRGTVPGFNIDGVSTQDALNAASGADNTDVGDLTGFDPRSFVDDAKADRNPLNDPQIAASMAIVDAAANTGATSPANVASGTGSNPLGDATQAAQNMTDKEKAEFAKSLGVTPPDPGGSSSSPGSSGDFGDAKPAAPAPAPDGEDNDEGGVVNAVVNFLKGLAKPPDDGGRLTKELEGTDVGGAVGTVPLGEAAHKQGIPSLEAAAAKALGGIGGSGGGGVKLVDPDADQPPTAEEIAFRQATAQALGIRRIPGDIDPGEGDGTQSSGPVNAGSADAIVEGKSKESLVGNPGAGGGQKAPAPSLDQGKPDLGGSRQGTDVDPLEGSAFTGQVRTDGPEDVDFNVGSEPLIGFGDDDEDDEEEEEDSDEADDHEEDEQN